MTSPNARQSRHGREDAPVAFHKSPDLGKGASDQRCFPVVAIAEPIPNSGGDCHNVLRGTTQLDARHVRAGVHAEPVAAKQLLQLDHRLRITRGDHRSGRHLAGHLFRMVRA